MSEQYNILFRGDLLPGHKLLVVKQKMAALFKVDAAAIDLLFSGGVKVLKRGLDEGTATRYRAALRQAGADVQLVVAEAAPAQAVTPPPVAVDAVTTVVGRVSPTSASALALAPVGEDLLVGVPIREVPPVEAPDFSLRPPEGNLLDEEEFDVVLPVLLPELDFSLSAVGEDLLRASELPDVAVAPVVVPVLEVGPVGIELGELPDERPAVNPDISGLSLIAPA